jgi:L-tyrosine isonitrile synthase
MSLISFEDAAKTTTPVEVSPGAAAEKIVRILLERSRRLQETTDEALVRKVSFALRRKISSALSNHKELTLLLPAFPYKSPNPQRVLGRLPDMSEFLSLSSLASMVSEISKHCPYGCKLVIGSDGRIYQPLQEVWWPWFDERVIADYKASLIATADFAGFSKYIEIVDLHSWPEFQGSEGFTRFQSRSPTTAAVNTEIAANESARRVYCGMKRFREEELSCSPKARLIGSNALKRAARDFTVDQIRFGHAWGNVLGERFPDAIRLSVHDHFTEEKLGIFLFKRETKTPWHSTAVFDTQANGWTFKKRKDVTATFRVSSWRSLAYMEKSNLRTTFELPDSHCWKQRLETPNVDAGVVS